ncbi:MAG: AI-2E family transporter [bacterium]|nr:AI-2E family transporter [bacterium]
MNQKKPHLYFLLTILVGMIILTFFIFRPFLYALALAIIFAATFRPMYIKILHNFNERKGLSALVTLLAVIALVFIPLTFLGWQIFNEAGQLYITLDINGTNEIVEFIDSRINVLKQAFPLFEGVTLNIEQYLKQGAAWVASNLGSVFSSFAKLAMSTFIFLIALYYFLKDGIKFKKAVVRLSPLEDSDDEVIIAKLGKAVNSIMRGTLIIALVQGLLVSIGFMIFGVPNAVLWGSVAAISAVIPGIGTALVITPAVIYLFLIGQTFSAIGLLIWGFIAVGLVDNFLGPKILGKDTELHPFLVLLSVLGGIAFFGPVGLLLGPLAVSLMIALMDIYLFVVEKNTNRI